MISDSRHDTLSDAESYADEAQKFAAQLRKFHPREAAYTDFADWIEAGIKDFLGHFAHIERELEDEEQSREHRAVSAQRSECYATQGVK